ncbi:hypothetical protein Cs7R123_03230 [Catellatospora sp. TT07R-123]|nr:hypothetical protein Cs7R123_03230 [Catellatospora sp. TT07R-123]
MSTHPTGTWVLLAYRIPREPSRPRIAVWRRLEALGVARLGDGLVALPADARTREHLDWIAEEVTEAGGAATVWVATAGSPAQERAVAQTMRDARAAEYEQIAAAARAAAGEDAAERRRALRRLREELRRVGRRDYFPPPQRQLAHSAVQALVEPNGAVVDAERIA